VEEAKTEDEKREVKRKYLKKVGLTSYSSETKEVKEVKRPDPLCPNGHVMNFEPMSTLEMLQPVIQKIEAHGNMPPGSVLGYAHCVGKHGNCARPIATVSFGWHICTHRPTKECDYLMRCHDCFLREIAEPQDLI